ncbi:MULTISPECIES: hypothetical protein [unclassified Streptomyces]|uniref:hypothetical protein n=1 Tax=unclassified Streptomyces TaxID=2593676 RepID=UPI00210DE2EF|nr:MULTISPECIES: hypothetical protein [unclassified Streptomyces]
MSRTYLITGAASGIGKATATRLKEQGNTVIDADLKDTDIVADLATPDGRAQLVRRAGELSVGRLDQPSIGARAMRSTARPRPPSPDGYAAPP